MGINWKEYYEKEAEINDFNPTNDPSEIQRCFVHTASKNFLQMVTCTLSMVNELPGWQEMQG